MFINLNDFVMGLKSSKKIAKTPSPRRIKKQLVRLPKIEKKGKKLPIKLFRPHHEGLKLSVLLLKPDQRGFTNLYHDLNVTQPNLNRKKSSQNSRFIYFNSLV